MSKQKTANANPATEQLPRLRTIPLSEIEPEIDDPLVALDGDVIRISVRYPYEVPLDRCATHQDILGWVVHLSRKTWMTPAMLRTFVHKACDGNGLKVPTT